MEIGDQNVGSREQEDMEIDSTKAHSVIDNVIADVTAAHGSDSMDSSQEPRTPEGEKEKTTTTTDDDATTTSHGRSTTESAQEPGKEGEKGKTTTPIDDASKSADDEI